MLAELFSLDAGGGGGDEEGLRVEVLGETFLVRLADSDTNEARKTLFACHLWQGAVVLARHMGRASIDWASSAVVEFGSGAGLPSMTAMVLGARQVVASDFSSEPVLRNLSSNIEATKEKLQLRGRPSDAVVVGHRWGDDVSPLLAANAGQLFDLAIFAECLWKHDQHVSLLASLRGVLAVGGTAIVAFSHHIPGLELQDLGFFAMAEELGFEEIFAEETVAPHMWKAADNVTIYIRHLRRIR